MVSEDGTIAWCFGAMCTGKGFYLTEKGKLAMERLHRGGEARRPHAAHTHGTPGSTPGPATTITEERI